MLIAGETVLRLSARGLEADRQAKLLIYQVVEGLMLDAFPHFVAAAERAELAYSV